MVKRQLFLLPFSGGNCYSYQFIAPYLRDFQLLPLELPGRGKRMNEPLLKDFNAAADDFYSQLVHNLSGAGFMIYGHSLGAYMALRLTGMLEKNGLRPVCLAVSGNPGPGIRENKNRYLMNHDDFVEELRTMGGVPDGFLENQELMEFFEPLLRADFEVVEKDPLDNEKPVQVPLLAIMGDTETDCDKIANWSKFTTAGFSSEILTGGHFFIHKHPERLAALIKKTYNDALGLRN